MPLPAQGAGTPPPPPGGMYGSGTGGPGGEPPDGRKSRKPLLIAGVAALVLIVAAVGVGAWALFSGHLGFGPLSAKDRAAVSVLGEHATKPAWASTADRRCAAEGLVKDQRSGPLRDAGLIKPSGDSWTYTGHWTPDTAQSYASSLLDCSDDWHRAVGQEWGLTSTACLGKVDDGDMAGLVAHTDLGVSGGDVTDAATSAQETLDDCYGDQLGKPTATATPGVLAVQFHITPPKATGQVQMKVTDDAGDAVPTAGGAYNLDVREGGTEGCITMEASVDQPWGSTQKSTGKACGKAKPRRLWWQRKSRCNETTVPCDTWVLHYEGFRLMDTVTIKLAMNGGDCQSASGRCTQTAVASARTGTWTEWTAPKGWHDKFTATVDGVVARVPN